MAFVRQTCNDAFVNKAELLRAILEALSAEFEDFRDIAKKTRAAGNDAESKSEGKYDTRSIEENYLADGLAKQAQTAAQSVAAYDGLVPRVFRKGEVIDLGAVIEIQFPGEKCLFFLGPAAGGTEIISEGKTIIVITPESPLGAQLCGLKAGESTRSPKALIVSVE